MDHRPGTDRGPADRAAEEPRIRAHPQRSLETSTAAHFHAAFQDHRTIPGVEQDPRLDGSFAHRNPGRITNHRAALGHRVRIAEEFDRVFAQQLLECGDEIVHSAQQHTVDVRGLRVSDGPLPCRARWNGPSDRDAFVREPRRGVGQWARESARRKRG